MTKPTILKLLSSVGIHFMTKPTIVQSDPSYSNWLISAIIYYERAILYIV
jgi:hypothetical protein